MTFDGAIKFMRYAAVKFPDVGMSLVPDGLRLTAYLDKAPASVVAQRIVAWEVIETSLTDPIGPKIADMARELKEAHENLGKG